MLEYLRDKLITFGGVGVLIGLVFLLLELSPKVETTLESLSTYQGTLEGVPMDPIKVQGIKIKTYKIQIRTSQGELVTLSPSVGLVTSENLVPFIGKPAVAKASETGHIWVLDLDGQPFITYDQTKRGSESSSKSTWKFALAAIAAGLLLLMVGYFVPRRQK